MSNDTGVRSLEEVLLAKNILSEEVLVKVEMYRRQENASFEQALTDLGVLSEDDIAVIYGNEFQIRFLKLEDVEIDHEAVRFVPGMVARRHRLIPVRRSGNSLAVAMADPTNAEAHAALRSVTDFEIIPFAGRFDAIEHAIFVHYGDAPSEAADESSAATASLYARSRGTLQDDRVSHISRSAPLQRGMTLDSLVEDAANQFALGIARSIASLEPEEGYVPFHVWGREGAGKSHLLQGIANHVTSQVPLKKVILTDGRTFAENLFESIRDSKINFFRYVHREQDLLLVDDAGGILSREWAQRELCETMKHLKRRGGKVVLAAETNLVTEYRLIPELKSLLESGVIAVMNEYSPAAKAEILRRKKGATDLPDEIIEYLVESCGQDLKVMLEMLQHVVIMAALGEREVTRDTVEEMLSITAMIGLPDDRRDSGRRVVLERQPESAPSHSSR